MHGGIESAGMPTQSQGWYLRKLRGFYLSSYTPKKGIIKMTKNLTRKEIISEILELRGCMNLTIRENYDLILNDEKMVAEWGNIMRDYEALVRPITKRKTLPAYRDCVEALRNAVMTNSRLIYLVTH